MLKITDIKITLQQVAGGETLILTDILPVKEFVDGKPTEKIVSYRYITVAPLNKYEKISIKVEEERPLFNAEELASTGTVKVTPIGFEGRFYRDKNGDYLLSAKASEIKEVE